jgi:hypothetical protein
MHVLLTHAPFALAGSRFTKSAALGAAAWVVSLPLVRPDWATAAILLAALVLVPLAMRLLPLPSPLAREGPGMRGRLHHAATMFFRAASLLQPWAALLLVPAFALPQGHLAGLLALPWTAVTALLAASGLLRFLGRKQLAADTLAHDAALAMLLVGGAFTFITRIGWQPLGFEPAIIRLTAVHFHYAGFVLPVLAGLAARETRGVMSTLMVSGIVVGMPLVALGIIFSRSLELTAVVGLTSACVLVAIRYFGLAARAADATSFALFSIAAASLSAAMLLAPLYAWGRFTGSPWLEITDMLPSHGACNAFGFALCGLLAWQRGRRGSGRR